MITNISKGKVQGVLRVLGLKDGRLRREWVSAAEGACFARVIDELTEARRSAAAFAQAMGWEELGLDRLRFRPQPLPRYQ